MSYEVLARKLRPMGFDALVGQDHVVRALRHALDAGRLHHAYLFTGTRGVGKTTIARIVAKSLNCEKGVSSSPCESCSICNEIRENRFVDLIEVDAASRTGVDDTRDLLENAQYLPTRGRYKVYLIDEVHMLSTASFNALLKTLEEPPEHVKFLLATTDPKKVPVTVLSRCLQFQLKNLSKEAIAAYLTKVLTEEQVEYEDAALDVISRSAAGSMRDALSLTDQAIAYGQGQLRAAEVIDMLGVVGRDEVSSLLDALAAGSTPGLMALSAELAERNADFADVLKGMMEALHNLSVQCALGDNQSAFDAEELQLYYQIALVGYRDLNFAPDPRSGFEMTLLRMLTFAPQAQSSVPPRSGSGTEELTKQTSKRSASPSESAQDTQPSEQKATQTVKAPESKSDQPPNEVANEVIEPVPEPPASVSRTKPVVADDPNQSQWFEWVSQLSVGGVTRMIAEHSILQELKPPKLVLMLDRSHDTLLSAAQTQHLARALEKQLEGPVELTVEVGEPGVETPAARRAREALERQARAEQSIAKDDVVRSLLTEFGGRVDQIRPI